MWNEIGRRFVAVCFAMVAGVIVSLLVSLPVIINQSIFWLLIVILATYMGAYIGLLGGIIVTLMDWDTPDASAIVFGIKGLVGTITLMLGVDFFDGGAMHVMSDFAMGAILGFPIGAAYYYAKYVLTAKG